MYPEDRTYENKILDLTNQEDEGGGEEGPAYICDHCELPMRISDENLSAVDGSIIVKQGSYYCAKCGMVWDSLDRQQQRVIKSQEKSGPRIPKATDNEFFFESVPSDTDLQPKHNEGYDPEPSEREQLEADGCTVLEERITTAEGRTIIRR
jgi:hypothetical protein